MVGKINQSYGIDHKLATTVSIFLIKLIHGSVGSIYFVQETFLNIELKKEIITMKLPPEV